MWHLRLTPSMRVHDELSFSNTRPRVQHRWCVFNDNITYLTIRLYVQTWG